MAFLGLSVFVWIMLIFLVILLIVLVVGDFADVDTDVGTDISGLSLPVIALFGTTFGAFAAGAESLNQPAAVAAIVGLVGGAGMAGLMYFGMVRFLVKAQTSSDVKLATLVGQQGNVQITVGPGRVGQVLVITEQRGRTPLPAVADEVIGTEEAVVVEGVMGNNLKVRRVR